MKALLGAITVTLTTLERELLEANPPETLPQVIADAESDYRASNDSNRDRLNERYLALLNLAAKLAPRPPPVPARDVELYRRYERALAEHQDELEASTLEEAAHLRESIKDALFNEAPPADPDAVTDRRPTREES